MRDASRESVQRLWVYEVADVVAEVRGAAIHQTERVFEQASNRFHRTKPLVGWRQCEMHNFRCLLPAG